MAIRRGAKVLAFFAMLMAGHCLQEEEGSDQVLVKLQKENDDLQKELRALEGSAKKETAANAQEIKQLTQRLQEAQNLAAAMESKAGSLQDDITHHKESVLESKRAVEVAKAQHQQARKELEVLRIELGQIETEKNIALQRLKQADQDVKAKLKEAEELLAAVKEAWLPLWAHGKYSEAYEALRPYVDSVSPTVQDALKTGRELTRSGSAKIVQAIDVAQVRSKEAWEVAHPHISAFLKMGKTHIHQGIQTISALGGEHGGAAWAKAKDVLQSTGVKAREVMHEVMTSPQVVEVKKQAVKIQAEVEEFAISHLKQNPATAAFASRPTVTYLLWAVLATPLVAIFLPVLLLASVSKTAVAPAASDSAAPSVSKPKQDTSMASGVKANKKGGKGRRITEGPDSIRVP